MGSIDKDGNEYEELIASRPFIIEWENLPWYIKAVVVAGWINIILFGIGFLIGFFGTV